MKRNMDCSELLRIRSLPPRKIEPVFSFHREQEKRVGVGEGVKDMNYEHVMSTVSVM